MNIILVNNENIPEPQMTNQDLATGLTPLNAFASRYGYMPKWWPQDPFR